MKTQKSRLVAVAITCVSLSASAEKSFNPHVSEWESVGCPDPRDWDSFFTFHRAAFDGSTEWSVSMTNGHVVAALVPRIIRAALTPPAGYPIENPVAATSYLKVDDGWIVGYHTEFHSDTYWLSEDGAIRRTLSNPYPLRHHLKEYGAYYAFAGKHGRIAPSARLDSRGSVAQLLKNDTGWTIEHIMDLPGNVEAHMRIGPGLYLIATPNMLIKASISDKKVQLLIPDARWGMLHQNSIAVDEDGYVYIGMKQYVARCRLGDTAVDFEYLIPDSSWIHAPRHKKEEP